jgi:hypothetical protein
MKTFIMFLVMFSVLAFVLLFSLPAIASDDCKTSTGEELAMERLEINTDVPKWLQGATIIVKQADGKESIVSADKFKVVPRKQQFIVTKTKQESVTMCKTEGASRKHNRVSLLGGYGSNGKLSTTSSASKATVEQEYGPVGGLQYQRSLSDTLSIGVQGQTNKNSSLLLGIDF